MRNELPSAQTLFWLWGRGRKRLSLQLGPSGHTRSCRSSSITKDSVFVIWSKSIGSFEFPPFSSVRWERSIGLQNPVLLSHQQLHRLGEIYLRNLSLLLAFPQSQLTTVPHHCWFFPISHLYWHVGLILTQWQLHLYCFTRKWSNEAEFTLNHFKDTHFAGSKEPEKRWKKHGSKGTKMLYLVK